MEMAAFVTESSRDDRERRVVTMVDSRLLEKLQYGSREGLGKGKKKSD